MVNFELKRYGYGDDSTLGKLSLVESQSNDRLCYTLEDERREVKVLGETCIPTGTYEIKLRTEGGMHSRYTTRFPDIHKGMLHFQNVPDFTWIYLHVGNTDKDTEGCPLLGTSSGVDRDNFFVQYSVKAYEKVYPVISEPISMGERVAIHVTEA